MERLLYILRHPFLSLPLPSFLRPSRLGPKRSLLLGLLTGFSLSLSLTTLAYYFLDRYKRTITRKPSKRIVEIKGQEVVKGVEGLIGNTPLIRINSLSDALGVEILGKCEYQNPFGSVKDRVSLQIIKQAEEEGLIEPHTNSCIFEGTSGSTGISIAGIARARGYKAHIVLPDDVAAEKVKMLEVLGATVEKVRPVSIVDKRHYVNLARIRAIEFGGGVGGGGGSNTPTINNDDDEEASSTTTKESKKARTIVSTVSGSSPSQTPQAVTPTTRTPNLEEGGEDGKKVPDLLITSKDLHRRRRRGRNGTTISDDSNDEGEEGEGAGTPSSTVPRGLFADQFENLSNYLAHHRGTGPEIYTQTLGQIDAFVSGAGTGGTIAGVGKYLKRVTKNGCEVVLADPLGSGLYHKVRDGVMYAETESEGKRRRYQVDTIVEGIGLNRITKNLSLALPIIDDAYRVTDSEAITMSRHLAQHDGLFLGSSSAVNLVTCVRLAQRWIHEGKVKPHGRRLQIVTILCDSGNRHVSKFWNDSYLEKEGITFSPDISSILSHSPDLHSALQHDSTSSTTTSSDTEGEEEEDQGESNPNDLDQDLASSDPSDLPPLDPELVDPRPSLHSTGRR